MSRSARGEQNVQVAPQIQEADLSRFQGHPVRLERFEGPLDLLLHLIKKDRIEIWEISISRITRQYLDYLATLQALNIEVAGEFLVMAATLMRIKSQNLLPRPSFLTEEDEGEEPMTRDQLIARLLEYKRFREAARAMAGMEQRQIRRHTRGATEALDAGHLFPLRPPRLFDLAEYLKELLERDEPESGHEVHLEEIKLEDQIAWLEEWLADPRRWETVPGTGESGFLFHHCLRQPGLRLEVVVTFLAILELAKLQRLRLWQHGTLEEIWLTARRDSTAAVIPPEVERIEEPDQGLTGEMVVDEEEMR